MRNLFAAAIVLACSTLLAQTAQARTYCTVRAGATTNVGEIVAGSVHFISSGYSGRADRPTNVTILSSAGGKMDVRSQWGGRTVAGKPMIMKPMQTDNSGGRAIQYTFSKDGKAAEIVVGDGVDDNPEPHLLKKIGSAKADCHDDAAPSQPDQSYNLLQARYYALREAQSCLASPSDEVRQQFTTLSADASLTPAKRAEILTPAFCAPQVEKFTSLNGELAKVGWELPGDLRGNVYTMLLGAFEDQASEQSK